MISFKVRPRPVRKPRVAPRLPQGDAIRRELRAAFRGQRNECLSVLGQPRRKTNDDLRLDGLGHCSRVPVHRSVGRFQLCTLVHQADEGPGQTDIGEGTELGLSRKDDDDFLAAGPARVPDLGTLTWPDLRLGQLKMSERMTPLLELLWDRAGRDFRSSVGLDPDAWEVTDPNTRGMIESAALDFCEATNATTSLQLDEALRKTREELAAGVVTRGESVPQLTKRVNAIFDRAETYRARRIAQTEASRAVHAAEEESARQSGVVAGWEFLASGDACPLCLRVASEVRAVRLGQDFAVIGDHPTYSQVRMPPIHPACNCSVISILLPEYGGPAGVEWGETLVQPRADGRPDDEAEGE